MSTRPVVIGAGHNGLVAAFYLARAGLRPLVLERRDSIGGAAVTREFHPGFRVSALAHACGPMRASVLEDAGIAARPLEWIHPETASLTYGGDGRPLRLARDAWKAAETIGRLSEHDAARYPEFLGVLGRLAAVVAELTALEPPSLEAPSAADVWALLKAGRRFRSLGRTDAYRLMRWAPMPIADVLDEWFESPLLKAAIAGRGILGTQLGPRSAGTTTVLLLDAARQPEHPLAPSFVRGGLGALSEMLAAAARQAGAEIRSGVRVTRVDVDEGGVRGVVLESGEHVPASTVVSNADPKATLLSLVDPTWLDPTLLWRLRNYRINGTLAKLNVALDGLPAFRGAGQGSDAVHALSGRIQIGGDIPTIERAFDASKYGRWSERPWLEAVVPSLTDPDLAPPGRHVMSIYAQYAPYALRGETAPGRTDRIDPATAWQHDREPFTRAVLDRLAEAAPDLPSRVLHVELLTPVDLEREHGLTGGHIHHGEMTLDQLFVMRPVLGWARYRMPIAGLYLCGAGTHPGGGITGLNGANAAGAVLADLRRGSRA